MSSGDHAAYQQSWLHLMGPLDELLEQARDNGSQLEHSEPALVRLLSEAAQQRDETEAAFIAFMDHRERLAHLLDRLQRELAMAGLPLKGDII
jgi:hypothetical protein